MSFSTKLFNNYFELKSFLSGENTILFLKENADKIKLPKKDELYFGRWRVVWIICKFPCEFLLSLFFSAISSLTNFVGATCISQTFSVLAKQMMRDSEQYECQNSYQTRLLVPAFNVQQISAYNVYTQPPFPLSAIKDPNVRKITVDNAYFEEGIKEGMKRFYSVLEDHKPEKNIFNSFKQKTEISSKEKQEVEEEFRDLLIKKGVKDGIMMLEKKYPFSNVHDALSILYTHLKENELIRKNHLSIPLFTPRGVCRGGTIWFNYLFLKTKHLFQDPKKQLIAIAELFRTGVPSQGCLLQVLGFTEESILGIKNNFLYKESVSLYEMDLHREKAVKKLQNLPNGIYFFGVLRHAFSYIKISDTEGYMWNPNSGLISFEGEDQAQQLLDDILLNHYVQGDKESVISITQVSLPDEKIQEQREIA